MKLLATLAALCLFVGSADAGDRVFITGNTVVQIKDVQNIAPFTIRQNFQFRQNFVNRRFGLVQQQVTNVPVFLPAFPPRRVRISRDGRRQKFDYGRFEVEIRTLRNGRIIVDYDD